jgi:hypothetical protein
MALAPTQAKIILDTLVASGATPQQVADTAMPLIGRVDRPAIHAFLATGVTAAQIASVAKSYVDKLEAKRARDRADQKRSRARRRCQTDVSLTSGGRQNPAALARAFSFSRSEESKEEDGGEDARARADRIYLEVEEIMKADRHWPASPSEYWARSVVVDQIARRLRLGQNETVILDTVRAASARLTAGAPINGFGYFDQAIARAHGAAAQEPQLSLRLDGSAGMKKPIEGDRHGPDPILDALDELDRRPISLAAVKGTQLLVKSCRLRKNLPDPRQFIFDIADALNAYSEEVITDATHLVDGLPGSLQFPLEIADVKKACDHAGMVLQLLREAERRAARDAAAATTQELLPPEAKPRLSEKELDEQFERHGLKYLRPGKEASA